MKTIYVGNLNYVLDETDLREVFQEFGVVRRVHLVRDRDTDHSRGFAFVEMPNDDDADRAVEALNGMFLEGRELVVNEAQPRAAPPGRESRDRGRGQRRRGGGRRW